MFTKIHNSENAVNNQQDNEKNRKPVFLGVGPLGKSIYSEISSIRKIKEQDENSQEIIPQAKL